MKIYCSLKYCPSADKMFYINDHKTTCHFLCLCSFWALRIHSRDLELCLLKWQSYTIQVSYDRCMKERKSPRSCWQHWCQSRWLRCECSYWSRGAGNVHQMNSCPPGSAAHSACWNSCHIKHWEKRAHKHNFSWKEQEDMFPIVTIKKYLNIYVGFMLISMSGGFI